LFGDGAEFAGGAGEGHRPQVDAVIGMVEGVLPSYSTSPADDLSVRDWAWMTRLDEFPHPLRADAGTLPPFELGALEPPDVDKDEVKDLLDSYRLALGRHGLAEERRLAYVAITRARHAPRLPPLGALTSYLLSIPNLVVSTTLLRVYRAPRLGFFFFAFLPTPRSRQYLDIVY